MNLIDKKELMKLLDDMFSRYDGTSNLMVGWKSGLDAVISEVSVMPTIEAEPIKYGKWIEGRDIHGFWDKCSCCGTTIRYDIDKYSRCPSCGAKMKGEEE